MIMIIYSLQRESRPPPSKCSLSIYIYIYIKQCKNICNIIIVTFCCPLNFSLLSLVNLYPQIPSANLSMFLYFNNSSSVFLQRVDIIMYFYNFYIYTYFVLWVKCKALICRILNHHRNETSIMCILF